MNFWVRVALVELVIFAIVGLLYLTFEQEGVWFLMIPACLFAVIALLRERRK